MSKSVVSKKKPVIGITESIDIPTAGIENIPCKIDTGAHTSSIHCEKVKLKEINGVDYIFFKLLDKKHRLFSNLEMSTSNFVEKKIRSSFGDYEYRYQVTIPILLGGKKFKVKFNLSNRLNMKFPVLLGMQFLRNKYVVDVSKKNLLKK